MDKNKKWWQTNKWTNRISTSRLDPCEWSSKNLVEWLVWPFHSVFCLQIILRSLATCVQFSGGAQGGKEDLGKHSRRHFRFSSKNKLLVNLEIWEREQIPQKITDMDEYWRHNHKDICWSLSWCWINKLASSELHWVRLSATHLLYYDTLTGVKV